MKEIKPVSDINAVVRMPGSKSITHRALIAASLAKGKSLLKSFLRCEDTLYTLKALRDMGIRIYAEGDNALVSGRGGDFADSGKIKKIFLGNSGTSYRLLLSVAALGKNEYVFTGSPRMQERPVRDLVSALNRLGADISYVKQSGHPPLYVRASGIKGGKVEIAGNISSQYISSLLLIGPYTGEGIEIGVEGSLVSRPYIDLTIDVMRSFGVEVIHDDYQHFIIPPEKRYKRRDFTIEGDVSSASYFWGAAAVTGGIITTENIRPLTTVQGDIAFLNVLEKMGCSVTRSEDSVTVAGGRLRGVKTDMGSMPDMVPTLAAIALFAEGKTVIRNVHHLRYKESDRIKDLAGELRRIGAQVEELEDGLIIHGGHKLSGADIDTHNDHRLAMSLAVAGINVPGIRVMDERCVDKSFPSFWEMWDGMKA
ncbi:MAG: 3-phosphoshikimate 1-carboxyvinyltransferase [Deltaproteobacteria bacterium]|nr:3-phosphoshikimate 1-carboxyvinyltransferase [Deltaproteobacteria bacterium]